MSGLLRYSIPERTSDWTLFFPNYAHFYKPSESTNCKNKQQQKKHTHNKKNTLVSSLDWDLPCPIRTIQIVSSLVSIPTNQKRTIWIPNLHKTDLIESLGGSSCYKSSLRFVLVEHNLGCHLNPRLTGCSYFCTYKCFFTFYYSLKLVLVYILK